MSQDNRNQNTLLKVGTTSFELVSCDDQVDVIAVQCNYCSSQSAVPITHSKQESNIDTENHEINQQEEPCPDSKSMIGL